MKTEYKNNGAILLESPSLRAVFIPNSGGKLSSLIDCETGFEYMLQRDGDADRKQPYAGSYGETKYCGFDDLFPTIDECLCEQYPWQGVCMPDHGELWSLPWSVQEEKNHSFTLSVHGVRFPYTMTKRISFCDDRTLRWDYELRNESTFDFDYLWAAHIMLNLQEGTRIVLPEECQEAVSVLSKGSSQFAESHKWPMLKGKDGQRYPANIVRGPETAGFEKFYFPNRLSEGWCRLEYPNGQRFEISFDTESVPFLGLLINEMGDEDLYTIIVEPCSVGYDRPDLAKKFGHRSILKGSSTLRWSVTMKISREDKV